jgi:bifunctional UDP-N-acetylglucosamine pyrophosphorylase / glucosamine-1-phosphate N-acetyltransferase
MNKSLTAIILAAGQGTRMKSQLPKVMHKIAQKSLIDFVINQANKVHAREIITLIAPDADILSDHLTQYNNINTIIQNERLGTAHAVQTAMKASDLSTDISLILYGDTPFIGVGTLNNVIARLKNSDAATCFVGFNAADPTGYGRMIVKGDILNKIVEHKEANELELQQKLCNSGIVAIKNQYIKQLLDKVSNNNQKGEFYLTDIVEIAQNQGLSSSYIIADEQETLGINSREQLAVAEKIWQQNKRRELMNNGVTLIDPESVYLSFDTNIAQDVIIYPNVFFKGNVNIESGTEIKSFSYIEDAIIGKNCDIGPFARIRPNSKIGDKVKIGNFVEIKNTIMHEDSKASHLAYLGDAEIGIGSNIGAGTITCNFDGKKKGKTIIGNGAFIGSNSALVAPLNIGDNATIGAGSVITQDVEEKALAIARPVQKNIPGKSKV